MLTTAQLTTFADNIRANADSTVADALATGNDGTIASWYNQPSTIWVWKPQLNEVEAFNAPGFDWTLVDGLTVGKRDEWLWLFRRGYYNPSMANQRAAIADIWTGTSAKLAVQAAILTASKRQATFVEALFVTTAEAGAGSNGTQALPKNLIFIGQVYANDVAQALRP